MSGITGQLKPNQSIENILEDLRVYANEGKHGKVVNRHLEWILEKCVRYEDCFQFAGYNLKKYGRLDLADSEVLYALYDSSKFRGIAETRKAAKISSCPYCGISSPVTLDHYLPRNEKLFPHLSFFLNNLVPSCTDCQGAKGTFFPTQKLRHPHFIKRNKRRHKIYSKSRRRAPGRTRILNTKRIIHPYYDRSIRPEQIWISFNIDEAIGPYDFRIFHGNGRMTPSALLFQHHAQKLCIESRLQQVFRHSWDNLPPYLAASGSKSAQQIESSLKSLSVHHALNDGSGSAKAIFFKCMALSKPIIDILVQRVERPNPRTSRTR